MNNEIYKINTSVVWAKGQLQILADMAESEGLLSIRDEAIRIKNGLRNLQQEDAADIKYCTCDGTGGNADIYCPVHCQPCYNG